MLTPSNGHYREVAVRAPSPTERDMNVYRRTDTLRWKHWGGADRLRQFQYAENNEVQKQRGSHIHVKLGLERYGLLENRTHVLSMT